MVGACPELDDGEPIDWALGVLLGPCDLEQRQVCRHAREDGLVAVCLAANAHAEVHHLVIVEAELLEDVARPRLVVNVDCPCS